MRKILSILLFLIFPLIIIFFLIKGLGIFRTSYPPERPVSVPENTVWRGGKDAGYWYEVVHKKDNLVHVKIYGDRGGNIIIDKQYTIIKDCDYEKLSKEDLLTLISYGTGGRIYLKSDIDSCYMF